MVKDLYLTRRLDVDIGTLVNVALAETFIKRYHLEVNDDPHSTVSPWTPDNRRVITFHAPLKAPDMVKKVVGVDVLPVSEKQFIRYDQATRVVTVETEPLINIAGGERFKTNAVMVLQPAGSGSEIVISANLAVAIWGVQGAIEAVMCAEAKGSFERWVDLLHEVCIECLDRACTPEAPLPIRHLMLEVAVDLAAPPVPAAGAGGGMAGEAEDMEFFDCAQELALVDVAGGGEGGARPGAGRAPSPLRGSSPPPLPPGVSSVRVAMAASASPAGPAGDGDFTVPMWYMQKVLGELSELRVSTEASRATVMDLDRRLQRTHADLERVSLMVDKLMGAQAGAGAGAAGWALAGVAVGVGVAAVVGAGVAGAYARLALAGR